MFSLAYFEADFKNKTNCFTAFFSLSMQSYTVFAFYWIKLTFVIGKPIHFPVVSRWLFFPVSRTAAYNLPAKIIDPIIVIIIKRNEIPVSIKNAVCRHGAAQAPTFHSEYRGTT